MNWFTWGPRKSTADRRADAARAIQDAARRGQAMSPVAIAGRTIAHTFWGKAWCDNLERYRDFAYRLERGRSYLRSGSVIDLRIADGQVAARVSGSSLYDVRIEIDAVSRDAWHAIRRDCAGGIGSRIDLLAGTLSQPVMARLCADRTGLFPAPSAIRFRCSCPDIARMCKHVAAAMYGVGARLDHAPDLLFRLRQVSLDELLAAAVSELPTAPNAARVLASDGLGALFGIELADAPPPPAAPPRGPSSAPAKPKPATRPSAQVAATATAATRAVARPTRKAARAAGTPRTAAKRAAPTGAARRSARSSAANRSLDRNQPARRSRPKRARQRRV
jgi:uncharacterized Zn finger protein